MKVYRILAALGFVLLLCGWWLLATPAGTRWSLSLLPGVLPQLELQGVSGSWIGGVRVSHLRYNAPVVEVTLSDLAVTVRPLFLLAGTLQISSAEAESVVLRLIDPAKPSTRKGLPTVALPLTLAAQRLDVSRFELITRGGRRVEAAIRTALRWRGTWIDANGAVLDAYGYRIETDLAIQLRGEYAVDAQLRLLRPGSEHELDAQLGGSLASLQFEGRYRGLAPLSYRGGARLLDQGLPLWLEAAVDADSTLMLGGSSVEARRGELKLDGELNELAGKLSVVLRHEQLGNVELHAPLTWRDSQLGLAGGRVELDRGAIVSDCTMVLKQSQWGCQGKLENISSRHLK